MPKMETPKPVSGYNGTLPCKNEEGPCYTYAGIQLPGYVLKAKAGERRFGFMINRAKLIVKL